MEVHAALNAGLNASNLARTGRTRWLSVRVLGAVVLMFVAFSSIAADQSGDAPNALKIKITGLDPIQEAAVRSALSLNAYEKRKSISEPRLDRLIRQAPGELRDALEPFGFYQTKATVSSGEAESNPRQITIEVALGAPVTVSSLHVVIDGAAARNERIASLIEEFKPALGEVFDHAVYEVSKARIERALQRRGYFDQRIVTARVEVNRSQNRADIVIDWDSGTRYLLGDVQFSGSQFDDEFLRRYLPWKSGSRYDQQRIETLQQALAASNYFSSIEVLPDVANSKDLHVPISVTLAPAKRTAYIVGASYDTDYGAGVRFGVNRRWVNLKGHTFASETEISQNLSSTSLDYRIPHRSDSKRFYLLGARYRDENTEAVDATSTLLSAGLSRTDEFWTTSVSLNALQGSFVVGTRFGNGDRQSKLVLYPEFNGSRVFAEDRIRPDHGASLRLSVRGADTALASDVDFLQAQIEGRWITSFNLNTRLLLRGELGATHTDQFAKLPPELRFFAGGDRSVRGYGYQGLGDRDAFGTAIGGKYLTTASIELERTFIPDWSGAVFIDVGDVFSRGRPNLSRGVGAGVRWASPVGPIRLDIGHGLDSPDHSIELHISAGPDL